jgi:hypothetical protein
MLVCYHGLGSLKKITPPVFLFVNIAVWFLTPAWGQDFLWLTGSLNYLWALTLALLFLVPYRRKCVDNTFRWNAAGSVLLFVAGVITGWGMQNLVASICVLLTGYFIRKLFRKEKICFFEILGTVGILTGFYFLLLSSNVQFPGIKELAANFINALLEFIRYCGVPVCIVVVMGIEILWFRKSKIDLLSLGYFLAALVSFFSLVLGYIKERALLVPIVFLIISALYLLRYFYETPKRYWVYIYAIVFCAFLPSLQSGGADIVKGYLISRAREEFIYTERERGVSAIYVKTPIPIRDSHSGLSGGIDILSNPDNVQYRIHNTAKSLFYNVRSLTGIRTGDATHLRKSFEEFFNSPLKEWSSIKRWFLIVYQNWADE